MQGNDLGTMITRRNVVVLEPLLMYMPKQVARWRDVLIVGRRFGKRAAMAQAIADMYVVNQRMLMWIARQGHDLNTPTEVWSFLPEDVTELLSLKIEPVVGRYIACYTPWLEPQQAARYLRAERDICAVYDANEDRVSRYWQLRGFRVLEGDTP